MEAEQVMKGVLFISLNNLRKSMIVRIANMQVCTYLK